MLAIQRQQHVHPINSCRRNVNGIRRFAIRNRVATHQQIGQLRDIGNRGINGGDPTHTFTAQGRSFGVSSTRLCVHILRDVDLALRRDLLPPPQRRRLLEGDVRQRRGTTVQKAPERRLAIDFQLLSLFSHQHAFLLEPSNNAPPPTETSLIIPRSVERRQIDTLIPISRKVPGTFSAQGRNRAKRAVHAEPSPSPDTPDLHGQALYLDHSTTLHG